MNNLTDKWEKDKIYKGTFYCKSKLDGHQCIAGFVSNKGLFDCAYNGTLNKGYWEILAEVPSFEQWQAKLEQSTKLKKLLKKHRDIFARTLALCIDLNFSEKQKNQFADDIAEIDQVLGEKK